MIIITFISIVLIAYLGWGVVYQLFYAILGLFWKDKRWPKTKEHKKIAVFIPGYKEDAVIVETAQRALKQTYPTTHYEIIIIADSFNDETLNALHQLPIRVEEVCFEISTKSKAINAVLKRIDKNEFDILVILDADNIMETNFLERTNAAFSQGVRVLQGRRVAKNTDTTMAVLDGLSEDINNHILCKGHSVVRLSSRLAGSAMAFDWQLFGEVMPQIDAIGGFDKELELRLTKRKEFITYDPLMVVYDEKVRKGKHFSNQRSRWIAAQFHYARRFFLPSFSYLFRYGQWDHFNKASQMLLPPRLLTPGILGIGSLLLWLFGFQQLSLIWGGVFALNIISFSLAMPSYAWKSPYRDALFKIPFAFWHALISLIGLRKANKKFIHTPHGDLNPKN